MHCITLWVPIFVTSKLFQQIFKLHFEKNSSVYLCLIAVISALRFYCGLIACAWRAAGGGWRFALTLDSFILSHFTSTCSPRRWQSTSQIVDELATLTYCWGRRARPPYCRNVPWQMFQLLPRSTYSILSTIFQFASTSIKCSIIICCCITVLNMKTYIFN